MRESERLIQEGNPETAEAKVATISEPLIARAVHGVQGQEKQDYSKILQSWARGRLCGWGKTSTCCNCLYNFKLNVTQL